MYDVFRNSSGRVARGEIGQQGLLEKHNVLLLLLLLYPIGHL